MQHTNLIQFSAQRRSRSICLSKHVFATGVGSRPHRLFLILFLLSLLLLLTLPVAGQGQFLYTTNNNAITITGYTGSNGVVLIPDSIAGLPVTSIGDWAFYATSVTDALIPDTVSSIGNGAFFDCGSLTNVIIGSSVTNIGDWAFGFCPNLTSVTFRGNAPSLGGADVFYGDTNLTIIYRQPWTKGWGATFGGFPVLVPGDIPLYWAWPATLFTTGNVTYAEYTWFYGGCEVIYNVGPLIRNGNSFWYDFDLAKQTRVTCPLIIIKMTTTVSLGTLAPGTYTLITTAWGTPVATNTFTIPVPTPTLRPIGFASDGSFQIELLNGVTNVSYVLQCSTNLVNWTSLSTNSVGQPLRDAGPIFPGSRFYRVQVVRQ